MTIITSVLDDAALALRLRLLIDHPEGHGPWANLGLAGRRAMSLRIEREESAAGMEGLVVRFPFGVDDRRQRLLAAGWQVEPNVHGTRYIVRRFDAPPGVALDSVVATLRQAYALVYGEGLRFDGWSGTFSGDDARDNLRWEVDLADGGSHVIEIPPPSDLTGPARVFRCDGAEHSLGGVIHRGPRVASFVMAGHPATMMMWYVWPGWRARLRRALGAELRPWVILAFLFGAGAGGGAAGAAGAATILVWTIYELTVDGTRRGSYVARSVGGVISSWTLVEPGGALPDGSNQDWPAARS